MDFLGLNLEWVETLQYPEKMLHLHAVVMMAVSAVSQQGTKDEDDNRIGPQFSRHCRSHSHQNLQRHSGGGGRSGSGGGAGEKDVEAGWMAEVGEKVQSTTMPASVPVRVAHELLQAGHCYLDVVVRKSERMVDDSSSALYPKSVTTSVATSSRKRTQGGGYMKICKRFLPILDTAHFGYGRGIDEPASLPQPPFNRLTADRRRSHSAHSPSRIQRPPQTKESNDALNTATPVTTQSAGLTGQHHFSKNSQEDAFLYAYSTEEVAGDFRCVGPLDHCLTFVRAMGGGPRTFPGAQQVAMEERPPREEKHGTRKEDSLSMRKQLYPSPNPISNWAKLLPTSPTS
nr:thiosulfate sulfurtransferase 16, chloroplastic-like [Ipomoea batatas]